MSKKKIAIVIIVLGLISALFIVLGCLLSSIPLFRYNLMELLTVVAASFGIYFITERHNDIKNKNDKVDEVVEVIRKKLHRYFDAPILKKKHGEYLYAFKYIDNKLIVLEKISKHLKCDEEIATIKNESEKLSNLILDNVLEYGDSYFQRENIKEKIPNILCKIEQCLDKIILKIYN